MRGYIPYGGEVGNFGDYLNRPLFRFLGFDDKFFIIPKSLKKARVKPKKLLLAIGSLLCDFVLKPLTGIEILVCGSGTGYFPFNPQHFSLNFKAVRGPKTARMIGVSLPLGDPALLFPYWVPKPLSSGENLLVLHVLDKFRSFRDTISVSTLLQKADIQWKTLLEKIAAANFVWTTSLHGAIVAQAYGVPWALAKPWGNFRRKKFCSFKWLDWLEFLGLEDNDLVFTRTLDEAQCWWEKVERRIRVPDVSPLMETLSLVRKEMENAL